MDGWNGEDTRGEGSLAFPFSNKPFCDGEMDSCIAGDELDSEESEVGFGDWGDLGLLGNPDSPLTTSDSPNFRFHSSSPPTSIIGIFFNIFLNALSLIMRSKTLIGVLKVVLS